MTYPGVIPRPTMAPAGKPVQEIRFGAYGNDRPYLGAGWSGDEPGYRWMIGQTSELWLEHPGPAPGYVLDIYLSPFLAPALPRQALSIRIRGQEIWRAEIGLGVGGIGCVVPPELLAAPGPVCLTFQHKDAAVPRAAGVADDDRMLAFSVTHLGLTAIEGDAAGARAVGRVGLAPDAVALATGMPNDRLMLDFESLGDNCEFGLVQRRCGAEPLSLLRFANIQVLALLEALRDRFARIGTPDRIRLELAGGPPREYVVQDDSYGITYHTFQYESEISHADLAAKQPTRQRFLARKLLEDLAAGEKILVIRRNPPLGLAHVLAVFAALRRLGPNRLLWADLAGADEPAGSVTELLPGLFRGAMDRLAPDDNAHDLSLNVWLEVLLNTWRLARAADAPGRSAR